MTVISRQGNPVALSGLSLAEIAAAFIMLVPVSLSLGRQSVRSTLGYMHPEPGEAAAFVKDVLTLPPGEVARKWYGDEEHAMLVACRGDSTGRVWRSGGGTGRRITLYTAAGSV